MKWLASDLVIQLNSNSFTGLESDVWSVWREENFKKKRLIEYLSLMTSYRFWFRFVSISLLFYLFLFPISFLFLSIFFSGSVSFIILLLLCYLAYLALPSFISSPTKENTTYYHWAANVIRTSSWRRKSWNLVKVGICALWVVTGLEKIPGYFQVQSFLIGLPYEGDSSSELPAVPPHSFLRLSHRSPLVGRG